MIHCWEGQIGIVAFSHSLIIESFFLSNGALVPERCHEIVFSIQLVSAQDFDSNNTTVLTHDLDKACAAFLSIDGNDAAIFMPDIL
ncbi:hypothetical protein RS75_15435 [Rhizobium nepotum 39/7]|uniref:Uncharacterized protein n=1 Tax=Rhizobium nepotum 39/7 TaxID=1368418 RepID=A0ABR5CQB1_9HYPH|nr:hypothetical protein RS75_15435 [Rhizobium nepotum 39/7]